MCGRLGSRGQEGRSRARRRNLRQPIPGKTRAGRLGRASSPTVASPGSSFGLFADRTEGVT